MSLLITIQIWIHKHYCGWGLRCFHACKTHLKPVILKRIICWRKEGFSSEVLVMFNMYEMRSFKRRVPDILLWFNMKQMYFKHEVACQQCLPVPRACHPNWPFPSHSFRLCRLQTLLLWGPAGHQRDRTPTLWGEGQQHFLCLLLLLWPSCGIWPHW